MEPDQETSEIEETNDIGPKDEIPVFLTKLENGNLVCHTGQGDFEFTDVPYEKVLAAKRRATHGRNSQSERLDLDTFSLMLISESMVSAKMPDGSTRGSFGELEIKKLKTSTVLKLSATVNYMYDIKSFLSM